MNIRMHTMLGLALACAGMADAGAQAQMSNLDIEVSESDAMRESHPDQHYRKLGVDAYDAGRTEAARRYYRMSARYADKLSQAALAEMYWNGEGGSTDQALGYIWMDMAAERGTRWMIAKRERYWKELSESDKQRAMQEGREIYAKYGDPVAKRRLERVMRVQRNQVAGSKTGFIGNVETYLPSSNGGYSRVAAATFYQDRFWKPDAYWKEQDALMRRQGSVEVGKVDDVSGDGK